jgi:hypothetical protein
MVPMCTSYVPKILTFTHSRWIWNNESGNIRELIFSGWEQRTLELPYTPAENVPFFPAFVEDPWAGLESQYKTN